MSDLNHAVLWRFNPVADYDLKFKDFLHLVFLGDVELMLQRSQAGMVSSLAGQLDPELVADEKRRIRYMGDPVKFAMSAQILRNLPFLTAIVPVFIFSLFIASLVKLSLPFVRRWPIFMENFIDEGSGIPFGKFGKFQRRKRRDEYGQEKVVVPSHIANITQILSNAVDGLEYLAQGFTEDGKQDEVIRYRTERSIKFAGYNERKARLQLNELTNLSVVLRSWLLAWVRILPSIANCLGQLIGCHVQFSYWSSLCKPIVPVASCVSIFGFSLESVAFYSYPY